MVGRRLALLLAFLAVAAVFEWYVEFWWLLFAAFWGRTWQGGQLNLQGRCISLAAALLSATAAASLGQGGHPAGSACAGLSCLLSLVTAWDTRKSQRTLEAVTGANNEEPSGSGEEQLKVSAGAGAARPIPAPCPPAPSALLAAAPHSQRVLAVASAVPPPPPPHRVLLLLLMVGCQVLATWQAVGAEQVSQWHPPGRLIRILHSRSLHLRCVGSGPSTAVLDSGLPFSSLAWDPLLALHASNLAANRSVPLRLCAYDRAGYGWSTPASGWLRTGSDLVSDLTALLKSAGVEMPLLVGWSYGGHVVASYACQADNRERLSGLVLLDTAAPDLFFCTPGFTPVWWAGLIAFNAAAFLQPLAFMRLLWAGGWGPLPTSAGGPPQGMPASLAGRLAAQCGAWTFPHVALQELHGMQSGDAAIAHCFHPPTNRSATTPPLGDLPVVVVEASDHIPAGIPGQGGKCLAGHAVQTTTPISTRTQFVQAGVGTDHFFPMTRPELVLEALSLVLGMNGGRQATTSCLGQKTSDPDVDSLLRFQVLSGDQIVTV